MEVLLLLIACFVLIVILIVAGSRTSLGKYLLPKRVHDAINKAAAGAEVSDAYGDGEGGFLVKLRGGGGLSDMYVFRRGSMMVSVACRSGASFPTRGTYAYRTNARDSPADAGFDSKQREEVDSRVRTAIDALLAAKGFTPEPGDAPTILVGYLAAVDGPVDSRELDETFGLAPIGGTGGDDEASAAAEIVYEKGSLVVDVVDAKAGLLMWRAAAQADIVLDVSREEKDARVNVAVEAMFSEYPPQERESSGVSGQR